MIKLQYLAEKINVKFSTFDEECLVSRKITSHKKGDLKNDFISENFMTTTLLYKVVF